MFRKAYLVVSNLWVKEVEILHTDGEFCVVRFPESNGGFQIRRNRLSRTKEEAERRLPKRMEKKPAEQIPRVKGPWEYPH